MFPMPTLDAVPASHFSEPIADFIADCPIPSLREGPQNQSRSGECAKLIERERLQNSLLASGLWLLVGELDESHAISQSQGSDTGSYWHGVMHRREGDFSNAKYWFRRAGTHPVFEELAAHVEQNREQLLSTTLDLENLTIPSTLPATLVDLVAQFSRERSQPSTIPEVEALQRIGWWEWQLLAASS
jgi:hypothetical protein